MKLNELRYNDGAVSSSKRVGRGPSSGHGKTSGRGENGQKSRSGYSRKNGFEGGQNPLIFRIPKRGFNNKRFETKYAIINVSDLELFEDGAVITPEILKETGLVKKQLSGIKVLGNGTLTKKVTVKASIFSKTAIEKIEKNGGKAEVI